MLARLIQQPLMLLLCPAQFDCRLIMLLMPSTRSYQEQFGLVSAMSLPAQNKCFVVDALWALPLAITFHAFSVKKPLSTEPGAVATGSWTQIEWRDPVATAPGSVTGREVESKNHRGLAFPSHYAVPLKLICVVDSPGALPGLLHFRREEAIRYRTGSGSDRIIDST